ncbi:MAG: hypothetical protein FD174_3105 [Geobacteraceae bacterium]|nr:MAG: hypothetical protein FD174_3105 [Geobacteraceae bacterium]
MAQVWKIAPGNRAEDWQVFSEHGCIGIGWLERRDYREFKNEGAVLEALQLEYGEGTKGCGKGAAEIIWRFVDGIKPTHIVIANDGYNRMVGIGIVESEYIPPTAHENPMRDDMHTHRHHVRLIKWIIRRPADVPGTRFFVQRTLHPLDETKVDAIKQAYLIAYPDDSEILDQLDQLFGDNSIPETAKARDFNDVGPGKVLTTAYRILRDTELARRVKVMHNFECQICGYAIVLGDGSRYAEAHHIRPLGSPHDGPDIMGNIICLCPNHHAECDLGVSELSLSSLHPADGHDLEPRFIEYHNREIYMPGKR